MADPQVDTTPEAAAPREPAALAPPGEDTAVGVEGERRAFAATDEAVGAVRHLSTVAAEATKQVAERSRQATLDVASSWRGAVEPFLAMQMEMNRWFDDQWRQAIGLGAFPALRAARPFAALSAAPMFGLPAADVKETETAYLICAELPGLTRDDVELQVRADLLLLRGQKAEEKETSGCAYRVSERLFGRFERRFPIPADVDRQAIGAAFRDGVLTVTLPKTPESAQPSAKIEIRP